MGYGERSAKRRGDAQNRSRSIAEDAARLEADLSSHEL